MNYNITYGDVVGDSEVVTVEMAKANSNIFGADALADELYELLLDAAIEDAENYIGTSILKRQVSITLSEWQEVFELPIYPVQSITSIQYVDAAGATQTVSATDYLFFENVSTNKVKFIWDDQPETQEGNEFPITITCTAGYDNDNMPAAIKSAVLLRFSHKERFREDVAMPTSYQRSFQNALRKYKRW